MRYVFLLFGTPGTIHGNMRVTAGSPVHQRCRFYTPPQCRLVSKSCVHHGVNSVFILNASVCVRVNLSKAATHFLQAKSDRSSRPIVSPDISDSRSAILSLRQTVENKACDQRLYRTPCKRTLLPDSRTPPLWPLSGRHATTVPPQNRSASGVMKIYTPP